MNSTLLSLLECFTSGTQKATDNFCNMEKKEFIGDRVSLCILTQYFIKRVWKYDAKPNDFSTQRL